MHRGVLTLTLVVGLAAPVEAQWLGEPVWNSPAGGGLAISGDYARPNSDYGGGNTLGLRASRAVGSETVLTAGLASWEPGVAHENLASIGLSAAFRLPGVRALPMAMNLQVGAAYTEVGNFVLFFGSATTVTGALGLSLPLAARGWMVEPYFSPGLRYRSASGGGNSKQFGYAIGANVGFGSLGVHLAYDTEKVKGGGDVAVFGVGAHVAP